nr:neuropilin (nrp) and tolloid (tll) [Hymenolepis microstoma]
MPTIPMGSSKVQMLICTLLVIISTRTHSRFITSTSPPSLSRTIRADEKAEIIDLIPQPEICKEFVESKASPRGTKGVSPADIFFNLSIGRDFTTLGRKPAKSYVFQSPNYPREYPMNIDCFKLIKAPSEEHRIFLQILRPFAVEPDAQCFLDFLEVRDGAFGFSPLIGRFCSRLPPPDEEIRSSGRYLWLRFRSDSTLRHAGFRATYHFEKVENIQDEYEEFQSKILRRLSVIQMSEDEQWTMRSGFLTRKLEYISYEERQLPLEAVFDIRSPPGTNILLFVHHFQVPQATSWSCDPHFLAKQKSTHFCDHNSRPIIMKMDTYTERSPNILKVKQYTKVIPDPTSYMDGLHTYAEIYADGQTLAEASPPCPRVDRFCLITAHSDLSGGDDGSNGGSGSGGSDASSDKDDERPKRQFVVKSPRLVIRIVVAKPSKPPPLEPSGEESVMNNGKDPYEADKKMDLFIMLPNFTFTLTTLSPRVDGACAPNQRACDESYCIQIGHWCDGVVNCPLGQDEGDAACNPEKTNPNDSTDEPEPGSNRQNSADGQDQDMEKHSAIIGSISLILIVIALICMFFAIRRKRKEASNHIIEIKLPPELDSSRVSSNHAKNGIKNASSASLQAAKLLNTDVIIDMDELENDPPFSSSGDALLGRDSGSNQKGVFANHNWERKASPAITRAFGVNSNAKSPATKSSKSRNALLQHQQIQQRQQQSKQQRNAWQSDVNLIQHSQTHHTRGKLNRGDSAKTADEVTNLRYIQPQLPPRVNNLPPPIPPTASTKSRDSRNSRPSQPSSKAQEEPRDKSSHRRHHQEHHHRTQHQKSERDQVQRQKTFNMKVKDQEAHVLNCKLLTEQQRTRSLATSRFRLYDNREIVDPYGVEFSSSRSTSTHFTSSSKSTESFSSTKSSTTTSCSSKTFTSVSYNSQKRIQRGYENLVTYSVRLKAFRSMPDVARATGTTLIPSTSGRAGGDYQLAVNCGHKDCRDYYRLQALRSDLQTKRNKRPNKISLDKPMLLREREIELTPSSEEGDALERIEDHSSVGGNPGDKSILLPNPIASDAYSVHGLSDAVSVESSKGGSEASHSAFTDESNEHGRDDSYSSTESPLSPLPPSRMSSANRSLPRTASLSKRMDSPSSSRSRVRVHPTAPNPLVYEYEA